MNAITSENILMTGSIVLIDALDTMVLTEEHFDRGNTLGAMSLPKGSLVIMIKRDDRYMVPNGTIPLHAGDTLLLMREAEGEGSGVE